MRLSIIVPCFNEQEVLPFFMEEVYKTLHCIPDHEYEIIFVNDGSKDETIRVIKILQRLIHM
ncbi:Prophage bactoprenol glucosyl transferase [Eubacterium plexicaudatum ASF492]|nr:Prophage bactoprenol glucosyl transferase [Eubacterium plexicaudatum ASF492]